MSAGELAIYTIFIAGIWLFCGFNMGTQNGRVQVASGEYKCELTIKSDQTGYWHCEEIK